MIGLRLSTCSVLRKGYVRRGLAWASGGGLVCRANGQGGRGAFFRGVAAGRGKPHPPGRPRVGRRHFGLPGLSDLAANRPARPGAATRGRSRSPFVTPVAEPTGRTGRRIVAARRPPPRNSSFSASSKTTCTGCGRNWSSCMTTRAGRACRPASTRSIIWFIPVGRKTRWPVIASRPVPEAGRSLPGRNRNNGGGGADRLSRLLLDNGLHGIVVSV